MAESDATTTTKASPSNSAAVAAAVAVSAEEKEISDETSKRICAHMNEDHAVSVYAMAKRKVELPGKKWKISDVFLRKVTMKGCNLQVIMCHKMLCQDVKLTYPFEPALTEPSQIRSRIIAIHHEVCTPFAVYTHPLFSAMVVFFVGSAWYTLMEGASAGTGIEPNLARAIKFGFYLTLLGHTCLGTYGAYLCRTVLKLSMRGAAVWYAAIFFSGLLAFGELQELLAVDRKCKNAKKEKAS